MKHILTVSIAIVAIDLLSGNAHPVPSSLSVLPPAVSATRSSPPETRSFAYKSGKEVGGETVTRNGDMISGDMAVGVKHVHYEGRIAADGTIPRLDMRVWRSAAEAKHPRVMSVIVGRDSTKLIEHLGSRVDTLRFASQPGMLPLINPSVGLMELLVARARSQKSRPARVPILLIDALDLDSPGKDKVGAAPMAIDVTFLAADTVRFGNGPSTDQLRIIIGADGRSRGGESGSTAKDKFSFRPTSKAVSSRE
jgi:hypothetical protein